MAVYSVKYCDSIYLYSLTFYQLTQNKLLVYVTVVVFFVCVCNNKSWWMRDEKWMANFSRISAMHRIYLCLCVWVHLTATMLYGVSCDCYCVVCCVTWLLLCCMLSKMNGTSIVAIYNQSFNYKTISSSCCMLHVVYSYIWHMPVYMYTVQEESENFTCTCTFSSSVLGVNAIPFPTNIP